MKCEPCQGVGTLFVGDKFGACGHCLGTGTKWNASSQPEPTVPLAVLKVVRDGLVRLRDGSLERSKSSLDYITGRSDGHRDALGLLEAAIPALKEDR